MQAQGLFLLGGQIVDAFAYDFLLPVGQGRKIDGTEHPYGALATQCYLEQDFAAVSAEQPVSTGQHHYHGENMNNKGADVAIYVQKYKGFDMAVEPYRSELGRKWVIRASVRRDKEVFTSRRTDVDYCCCGLDAAREAGFQHCRILIDKLTKH